MPLESVKSLCEKAGIEPASKKIPERAHGHFAPSPESYVLHDMSLRHVCIVLDHDCCPTQKNGLWYDGHMGMQGGASSMLLAEAELARHKERLFRFAHEEIAAFNIAQIDTGLAVIGYLKERTLSQETLNIVVTSTADFRSGARLIVVGDAGEPAIGLSDLSPQSERRLAL